MARSQVAQVERLLTVAEVAELLSTTERFPRRLIAERRIRFVHVGRHVRIPESALRDFIKEGQVEPANRSRRGRDECAGCRLAGIRPAIGVRMVLTAPLPELSEPNQKQKSGSSRQRQRSAMIAG